MSAHPCSTGRGIEVTGTRRLDWVNRNTNGETHVAELSVELVAVERRLWSGRATMVIAQTTEGELGVLAGHEPLLSQLVEGGVVKIRTVDDETVVAAVHGGFL